jgi:hypothetical protein
LVSQFLDTYTILYQIYKLYPRTKLEKMHLENEQATGNLIGPAAATAHAGAAARAAASAQQWPTTGSPHPHKTIFTMAGP